MTASPITHNTWLTLSKCLSSPCSSLIRFFYDVSSNLGQPAAGHQHPNLICISGNHSHLLCSTAPGRAVIGYFCSVGSSTVERFWALLDAIVFSCIDEISLNIFLPTRRFAAQRTWNWTVNYRCQRMTTQTFCMHFMNPLNGGRKWIRIAR